MSTALANWLLSQVRNKTAWSGVVHSLLRLKNTTWKLWTLMWWLLYFCSPPYIKHIVVSGHCRCRNKELLQEDGLWAGGALHGEGPVWIWNGLRVLSGLFFICLYTQKHIETILFIKPLLIGHASCLCSVFHSSEEIIIVFFSQSVHVFFIWCTHCSASPLLFLDKSVRM